VIGAGFVVDAPEAQRPDLAERRETKYLFERADPSALRSVLRAVGRPIVYAGRVSFVRSIYYDDAGLSACRANLAGVGVRRKVRLRWYDHDLPTDRFQLEIKWRKNQITGKHRFGCTGGEHLRGMALHGAPAALARGLPPAFAPLLDRAEQPVAIVGYRREHFAVGAARLTLDYDLRFVPLLGHRGFADRAGDSGAAGRFEERLPDVALVEVKTPLAGEPELLPVLRALRARPGRLSKHVVACQRIGFVGAG
jgi:hypothetical protein